MTNRPKDAAKILNTLARMQDAVRNIAPAIRQQLNRAHAEVAANPDKFHNGATWIEEHYGPETYEKRRAAAKDRLAKAQHEEAKRTAAEKTLIPRPAMPHVPGPWEWNRGAQLQAALEKLQDHQAISDLTEDQAEAAYIITWLLRETRTERRPDLTSFATDWPWDPPAGWNDRDYHQCRHYTAMFLMSRIAERWAEVLTSATVKLATAAATRLEGQPDRAAVQRAASTSRKWLKQNRPELENDADRHEYLISDKNQCPVYKDAGFDPPTGAGNWQKLASQGDKLIAAANS